MVNMAHQAGSGLSIYLEGLLYDRYGSYSVSFAMAAAFFLVASVTSFAIREKRYSVKYRAQSAAVPGQGY